MTARPVRGLRALGRILGLALGLALPGCVYPGSHGPAQDHSRFESAVLIQDHTVLFSFKHLVYRPARGFAAFPDGGVPRYLKDEDILATYHIPSGALRVLRRTPNRRWTDGQGQIGIQQAQGSFALATQGGQLRGALATIGYEDWLVDVSTGSLQPLDWRAALAARGLTMTELRLVDARGTLLFTTLPAAAARGGRDDADVRLWIRTSGGEYVPVARTSHYEGMAGDDLVYWLPETRRYRAFNVVTRETRELPGYRRPPRVDLTEGVLIETHGQRLLFGRKNGDRWAYEPLPLAPDRLKEPDGSSR